MSISIGRMDNREAMTDYDYLVIGGGFYGCCLALFLRSVSKRVLVVESADQLMTRASRVNQARIHTGFHYPRSALTAVKSMILHRRFMEDFPEAVVDDFQMLYAIARSRSKVSARRFFRMFRDIDAPIQAASGPQRALFDPRMVDGVYACDEAAFDFSVLQRLLAERLADAGVELRLGTDLVALADRTSDRGQTIARLSDGSEVTARYAFNITYSQINSTLDLAGLPRAKLKHELAELALIEPPPELNGIGITLMDGPFFSCMPYPSERLYSLTHVRYTPHESWRDDSGPASSYARLAASRPETRVRHMISDSHRYLPCLSESRYVRSIWEVKTVLQKNEADDGRPILYQQRPSDSGVVSILGGKIDNIYDLFDILQKTGPEFAGASDRLVMGRES